MTREELDKHRDKTSHNFEGCCGCKQDYRVGFNACADILMKEIEKLEDVLRVALETNDMARSTVWSDRMERESIKKEADRAIQLNMKYWDKLATAKEALEDACDLISTEYCSHGSLTNSIEECGAGNDGCSAQKQYQALEKIK